MFGFYLEQLFYEGDFFYYLCYLIYMSEEWRNDPRYSKIKLSKKEKEELKKSEIRNEKITKYIRTIIFGIISIAIALFALARVAKFLN